MRRRRLVTTLGVLLLTLSLLPALADQQYIIVTIPQGNVVAIDCETVLVNRLDEVPALVGCAAATTLPTETPEPTATPSNTPTNTSTPEPTAAPAATATPRPLIEGVPICDHDATKWHGLVERNADQSIACTYGHTHMDDPRVLDAKFGPLLQEISYPWQTSSSLGLENEAKHRVYDWGVIQDQPCVPASGAQFGLSNARLETHMDGNAGATVRFHSFYAQAETCDPADPSYHGTFSIGGHMDTGFLQLQTAFNVYTRVPLPGDPPTFSDAARRVHGTPAFPLTNTVWYSNAAFLQLGVVKEVWGQVDPNEPGKLLFDGGARNGSFQEPIHLMAFQIDRRLDELDGTRDNVANFEGFADRFGRVVPTCAPLGPDCVPMKLHNLKVGVYQWRTDAARLPQREYDITSPATGKSLIVFPN